jgi:hypothetical protein
MASIEADRDDLFREAVALVRRAEWRVEDREILLGERANGWLSLYDGQDFALTWDEADRLRRAFSDGRLFRPNAVGGLTVLRRIRTAGESELARRDLDRETTAEILQAWRIRAAATAALVADRLPSRADPSSAADALASRLSSVLSAPLRLAPPIAPR